MVRKSASIRLRFKLTVCPGFCVEVVEYKSITFTVFDLGGQEKLAPLWRHYFEGTVAAIIVVDAADSARLAQARADIHKVLKDQCMKPKCVALLVNKMDLPDAPATVDSIRDYIFDAELDFKETYRCFPTSILDHKSLEDGLAWLAAAMAEKTVPEPSLVSRAFKKLTGLFSHTATEVVGVEAKTDLASSDGTLRIPSDEALNDNATFLRAFEQCILVRTKSLFLFWDQPLTSHNSQSTSGPTDLIFASPGFTHACIGRTTKRPKILSLLESSGTIWSTQGTSHSRRASISQ